MPRPINQLSILASAYRYRINPLCATTTTTAARAFVLPLLHSQLEHAEHQSELEVALAKVLFELVHLRLQVPVHCTQYLQGELQATSIGHASHNQAFLFVRQLPGYTSL
jgi:hypothetical protein